MIKLSSSLSLYSEVSVTNFSEFFQINLFFKKLSHKTCFTQHGLKYIDIQTPFLHKILNCKSLAWSLVWLSKTADNEIQNSLNLPIDHLSILIGEVLVYINVMQFCIMQLPSYFQNVCLQDQVQVLFQKPADEVWWL